MCRGFRDYVTAVTASCLLAKELMCRHQKAPTLVPFSSGRTLGWPWMDGQFVLHFTGQSWICWLGSLVTKSHSIDLALKITVGGWHADCRLQSAASSARVCNQGQVSLLIYKLKEWFSIVWMDLFTHLSLHCYIRLLWSFGNFARSMWARCIDCGRARPYIDIWYMYTVQPWHEEHQSASIHFGQSEVARKSRFGFVVIYIYVYSCIVFF